MVRRLTQWAVVFARVAAGGCPRAGAVGRGRSGPARAAAAADHHLIRRIRLPASVPFPPPQPIGPTYKIDQLEVNARLVDQVAQVQVSQSFENTGSRAAGGLVHFPVALRRGHPPVDAADRRQGVSGQAVGRQGGPAALRGDRAEEPRPGAVGVAGHGHVPDERVSGAARRQADGDAALLAALPPAGRADRLPLPLEHGEVHLAAGREGELPGDDRQPGGDQERLQPDARGRDPASRRPSRRGDLHGARTKCPRSDFRLLYDVGRGKLSARVLSYRPDKGEDGYFLLLASPEIKAPDATSGRRRR